MPDFKKSYGETLARELAKKIQTGTATLVAGTVTITARLTSTSVIQLTRNTVGGTVTSTIMYAAPAATRNVSASTFVILAVVAAGTINVADTSTVDWVVLG
jgi:uncharacterized protein (DUF697 family)